MCGAVLSEVQLIVKRLLGDSDNDKSLAINSFDDPCPELIKKQMQTMKGFDFADEEEGEVAFGSSALADRAARAWLCTKNKPFEQSLGNSQWRRCRVHQEVNRKWHVGQCAETAKMNRKRRGYQEKTKEKPMSKLNRQDEPTDARVFLC